MSRPADELQAGAARLRVRRPGGAPAGRADPARIWRRISELQRRAAACPDRRRLALLIVNDPGRLFPVRQAVLWRVEAGRRTRLQAVSGLSRLQADTPNALFLATLGEHLLAGLTGRGNAGAEGGTAAPVGFDLDGDLPALPAALAAERADFLPGPVRILTLDDAAGRVLAIVAFQFAERPAGGKTPGRNVLSVLGMLQPVWSRSWQALATGQGGDSAGGLPGFAKWLAVRQSVGRPSVGGQPAGGYRWPWRGAALAVLALAALAVPVRLTVLAPAEVIALDAVVVAAPLDGVLARFSVVPNQAVRTGQPLFWLDDTTLRNRRDVARQQLQVARAEVLAATQKAFAQEASRAGLAALEGRVAERAAELAWIEEQLSRVEVRSPGDGVAIFSDPNDWIGRPVTTGERILQVGSPATAGLLIWLSVNDALAIETGARVRLHLPTEPLATREARLFQSSYQAEPSPEGIVSYRLRARFETGDAPPAPRIGLRGTARIEGERVRLGYYLFRRPLAALREWTGW